MYPCTPESFDSISTPFYIMLEVCMCVCVRVEYNFHTLVRLHLAQKLGSSMARTLRS